MPQRTPKYLLIQERLGRDLADHLAECRRDGVSYERIARDLWRATDVEITAQSVQTWCADLTPTDDSAGVA